MLLEVSIGIIIKSSLCVSYFVARKYANRREEMRNFKQCLLEKCYLN